MASSIVAERMFEEDVAPLQVICSPYEVSAIRSMIDYVAQDQKVEEQEVESLVKAEFGVNAIGSIRHEDFRRAIVFLNYVRFGGSGR